MNENKNIVNEIVKNEAENSVIATDTETTEFVVDKYIRHRWLVIRSRCGKQKGYENVTFELDDYPRFQEWYKENNYKVYGTNSVEVDKDVLPWGKESSKSYRFDNILLLPKEINVFFKGFDPEKHVKFTKKEAWNFQISDRGKKHKFKFLKSKEEAIEKYIDLKTRILKSLIAFYRKDMPENVVNVLESVDLYNYEFLYR